MTPNDIANKKFEKAKMGGYKTADVDNYISELAAFIAQQSRENNELKRRLDAASQKLSAFEEDQETLSQALLNAQRLADNIVRDARTKADIILKDADIKAETIKEKIKDTILDEQEEYKKLKKEISDFRSQILGMYKTHIQMIMQLPDPNEDNETKQETSESETNENTEAKTDEKQPETDHNAAKIEPKAITQNEMVNNIHNAFNAVRQQAAATSEPAGRETAQPEESEPQEEPEEQQNDEAPKSRAAGFKLNLKFDETTGEYKPTDKTVSLKYGNSKFNENKNDRNESGIFRRNK